MRFFLWTIAIFDSSFRKYNFEATLQLLLMSFSELTSSPQQKSHEGLLREARKRYFARYMSRSDKELDSDYAELLRIMNILRFKVTKAL